jgi:hypothetical protein
VKSRKTKTALYALLCLFLFVIFGADSCETPSPQTSSTSAAPTGADCTSLACKSIVDRYNYLNDPNKYGYFYGFVQGVATPVIEYVVQGSVFPVDDLVNPPDYAYSSALALPQRQPDQTYGTNGQAMFGKTADGVYFEWLGPYAYSGQPLTFQGNVKVVGCRQGIPGC